MKRFVYAGIAAAITVVGIGMSGGTATAGETGTIIGRKNCEDTARMYRDMGYKNVRCYHIHGDRYYVSFDSPRSNKPSTGSFGSS
ncbi:hypothetical protein [Nocardia otitidiscaviarum]|uniref:hypothetical protein n=1 Tax=Nocardia otitidiscaviarum TaxID=1823 RepID=UPI0004A71A03|nr:hypothetical protein [Nocardia otitidiscaviarum]